MISMMYINEYFCYSVSFDKFVLQLLSQFLILFISTYKLIQLIFLRGFSVLCLRYRIIWLSGFCNEKDAIGSAMHNSVEHVFAIQQVNVAGYVCNSRLLDYSLCIYCIIFGVVPYGNRG